MQTNSLGIASGHQAGSGRSAYSGSNAKMRKLAAFSCHTVELRRPMQRGSERLDVTVAQVIAKDDDEVGAFFFCLTVKTLAN